MRPPKRAEMAGGVVRRPLFFPRAGKRESPSSMGEELGEFTFRYRSVSKAKFYRDVIKPARSETAVEVTQSGNDHPNDGYLHVGPRHVEDEKIEARTPCDIDAG